MALRVMVWKWGTHKVHERTHARVCWMTGSGWLPPFISRVPYDGYRPGRRSLARKQTLNVTGFSRLGKTFESGKLIFTDRTSRCIPSQLQSQNSRCLSAADSLTTSRSKVG